MDSDLVKYADRLSELLIETQNEVGELKRQVKTLKIRISELKCKIFDLVFKE